MIGDPRGQRQDGFTLPELLIVLVVLGILSSIAIFAVGPFQDEGAAACADAGTAIARTTWAARGAGVTMDGPETDSECLLAAIESEDERLGPGPGTPGGGPGSDPGTGLPTSIRLEGAPNVADDGSAGTDPLAILVPSAKSGEILLAQVIAEKVGESGWICPWETGWNRAQRWNKGKDWSQEIFWRVVTADQGPTSFSFASTTASDCSGPKNTNEMIGSILRFSGADTGNPIDAIYGDGNQGHVFTAPSVTAATTDTAVLRLFAFRDNTMAEDQLTPSGAIFFHRSSTGLKRTAFGYLSFRSDAGDTGPFVASWTGSNHDWVAQTVVLRHR